MKKKTSVILEPEVDNFCDLVAQIIQGVECHDNTNQDSPNDESDDDDKNPSTPVTHAES